MAFFSFYGDLTEKHGWLCLILHLPAWLYTTLPLTSLHPSLQTGKRKHKHNFMLCCETF